jgi:hypothetical protein
MTRIVRRGLLVLSMCFGLTGAAAADQQGLLVAANPCVLSPGGAEVACASVLVPLQGSLLLVPPISEGRPQRVVTDSEGVFRSRYDGAFSRIRILSLFGRLGSREYVFDPSQFVASAAASDGDLIVSVSHRRSGRNGNCRGGGQGIVGRFTTGDRMPQICDEAPCAPRPEKGVAGQLIIAQNKETKREYRTRTTRNGSFRLGGLPAGSYLVYGPANGGIGPVGSALWDSGTFADDVQVLCSSAVRVDLGFFTY